jgi:Tol biopolymer transport system component
MALQSGSRLGPYEIEGVLGAGGMGEVYRARDPRLDREVAVKVLPPEIANRERLRRFAQEARAAGALNHPNVLAIYDVGEHDGVPYVVSELLVGEALRERIGTGLSTRSAVDYAIQIGRGLAAAHDKGIVHRDLKPDNLFVTKDGRVKILDFGLAKLRHTMSLAHDDERTATRPTESGTVLGTVGYMSPEQVRGEAVDPRADIFSFGAVLYEMLSGRRAFRGSTPAETLAAILNEDPPEVSGTARRIPPGLARIVHRCLEKRPGDRFHSAHDLTLALEAVSSGASRPSWLPVVRRRPLLGAGALLVLAAIAGLWIAWPREPPPSPLRVRPITSTPGIETDPALSPDGHQVAFVRRGEKTLDLYVQLIDGGEPLLLSRGKGDIYLPTWSPDGTRIAFLRDEEGEDGQVDRGVFVIPALGGAERRVAACSTRGGALAWSPDGQRLAVNGKESPEEPEALFLLSLESGERQRLTRPPSSLAGDSLPSFSPDGGTVAFVRGEPWENDIYLAPIGGGEERRLTVGNRNTEGLAWTPDGRAIVFSSWRVGGAGPFCLWRIPVSGGDPEPLDFGENGQWPTVSREGGRLAYTRLDWSMDIWRVGGPSAPDDQRSPTRLFGSTRMDLHPRYSPDGQDIAFTSNRSGALEIWVCASDGSRPRQLTFLDSSMTGNPIWSPDGQTIAFFSAKESNWDTWVVSASGGLPRRLTTGPAREVLSSWSRDGRWVYVCSNESGRNEVWKVPAGGGDAVQVTTQGGCEASESSDGRFLYVTKSDVSGPPGLWRISRDGGEETKVADWVQPAFWTVLDQGILGVDFSSRTPVLRLFDFATGRSRPLAELDNLGAAGFTASPDGRWVLYTGGKEQEADIMLVEGFR